ncbi:MAG TPA: VRR-NUC domain-containing protein [Mycobacteriales bacterium]|nr:VRR-NUC domain-containing protein [Mycobacteriales bacterium]
MTEAELLQAVRDLARLRGWLVYHTHRSDRSEPGFPDVIAVHPRTGHLLAVELKSANGRITRDQRAWLDALQSAGVDARVWYPADLASGAIVRALSQPGRPVAAAAIP